MEVPRLKGATPPDRQRAIEVTLAPSLARRRPVSKRLRPRPELRSAPQAIVPPLPSPANPAPESAAPLASGAERPGAPSIPFAGLRRSIGCADPEAYHLSAAERDECRRRLGAGARNVAALPLMIGPEKRAAFDRSLHCRRIYHDAPMPIGTAASNTGIAGLGYVPSLRECPAGDR